MSEQLLFLLKLCLIALLYLFFFRVLRAVWAELRAPVGAAGAARSGAHAGAASVPGAGATPAAAQAAPGGRRGSAPSTAPPQLVVVEPAALAGASYVVGPEATIGRANGCDIAVDDAFVSQVHARVFTRDGGWFVEDIGSTNGTFLDGRRVTSAVPIGRGGRIQVGSTVLELR